MSEVLARLEAAIEELVAEQGRLEERLAEHAEAGRKLLERQLEVEQRIDAFRAAQVIVAERGEYQPPPAAVPPTSSTARALERPTKYDHAQVAAVARAARAEGVAMHRAVAAQFGITPTAASQLIMRARVAGEDVPSGHLRARRTESRPLRSVQSTSAAGGRQTPVLCCEEPGCSARFDFDQAGKLLEHTLVEHRRQPSRSERTPRDPKELAA